MKLQTGVKRGRSERCSTESVLNSEVCRHDGGHILNCTHFHILKPSINRTLSSDGLCRISGEVMET